MSDTERDQDHGHAVAAWSAMYQAERADLSQLYVTALVVLGFALSYVVGVAAYIGLSDVEIPARVSVLLPLPVWAIMLYNFQLAALSRARSVSAERIEYELFDLIGRADLATQVGSRRPTEYKPMLVGAGENALGFGRAAGAANLVGTVAAHGVALLTVGGFTVYCWRDLLNLPVWWTIGVGGILLGLFAIMGVIIWTGTLSKASRYNGGGAGGSGRRIEAERESASPRVTVRTKRDP